MKELHQTGLRLLMELSRVLEKFLKVMDCTWKEAVSIPGMAYIVGHGALSMLELGIQNLKWT